MDDFWLAILIGTVEGVTEFLPVSSTGHMLLLQQALGVDLESGFWKLFTVVIQLGAILAVVVYYGRRLRDLAADFVAPARPDVPRWRHPLVLVLAAVVPAGAAGVLLKKQIDQMMEHALPIGVALIAGAAAIEWVERRFGRGGAVEDVAGVSPGQALGVGLAQVLSLVPGVSRSASTIMGGLVCGLRRRAAADFSFLLSVPTMTVAALYSLAKTDASLDTHQWGVLATGFGTAFVVAFLVVAWFLRFIGTHSFRVFVVYRIVLGIVVLAAWWSGRLP